MGLSVLLLAALAGGQFKCCERNMQRCAFTMNAVSTPPVESPKFRAATLTPQQWRHAIRLARAFVARESPSSALPFAASMTRQKGRIVFADYTPALPLSYDNLPEWQDSYEWRLPRDNESDGAVLARYGVWQRPLPAGPWPSDIAYATHAAVEIFRAQAAGVDGFLLDLLSVQEGDRNWETAKLLIDAAEASGTNIKVAIEPDMDALKNVPMTSIAEAISRLSKRKSVYRERSGHVLVVPFQISNQSVVYWNKFKQEMRRRGDPVDIIAQALGAKEAAKYASVSIGIAFWGGRDVESTYSQTKEALALSRQLRTRIMLPVAPQDFRPRPRLFWEARNTETFRAQWLSAIQSRASWVHLITWNDYTEGTAIAPSSMTQFLFSDLNKYFSDWYKSGRKPAVKRDALFYSFRNQIFLPHISSNGPAYIIQGRTKLANDIEVVSFLKSPALLTISFGGVTRHFTMGKGLETMRVSAKAGTPFMALQRGGADVLKLTPGFGIHVNPHIENGLYGGGSSLRRYHGLSPFRRFSHESSSSCPSG